MQPPAEKQALQQVVHELADLLEAPPTRQLPCPPADLQARIGPFDFIIEWKGSTAAAPVFLATHLVKQAAAQQPNAVPVVAVPYMGPTGQAYCRDAGVSWLDLSGNAHLVAPGLRILIEGKPNRFKHPGRPSTVFAPKSSRVARWLLIHPGEPINQRALAHAIGLGEGFTSRLVGRLVQQGLVVRKTDSTLRVPDPDRLLDAWHDVYDFTRHRIIPGHISARSSESLLAQLARDFSRDGVPYAATGLGAAWLMTHFTAFRIVTVYVEQPPSIELMKSIGFHEEPRGANTWLVVPNDDGVFESTAAEEGIRCVHPVQAYLDLKGHPERAREAAEKLREDRLTWPKSR